MATIRHTLRDAQQGSTRYHRAGRGAPIVLLHGLGMQASIWSPQVEALKHDYDVIIFDMLGHGESSLPPADAALPDYSDQLLSVMDALDLATAHVAGHSMGALICVEFALAHPERVRSVAALNGVYRRNPEQKAAALQRASILESARGLTSPDDTLARWFGDPVPASLAGAAETTRAMLQAVNPIGYARTYRLFACSDERHHGRLEQLAVPALFMTGEFDPHSTPAMSQAMADAAPLGHCEILPGERHMMTMTAPLHVTERLRSFHRAVAAEGVVNNRKMTGNVSSPSRESQRG